jgi:leader peptidase (prepilin peptidase)/N-methyltransferase
LGAVFLDDFAPPETSADGEEVPWQPGPTNLPFGPWLALGAIEMLLGGQFLAAHLSLLGIKWILG